MVLDGNDRETIAACQRGDREAFQALFETYQDKVYSIALRYSGERTVALDIAQEVFLKLLSSIQDFHGDAGFETWLYRVVVNQCLDHRRRGRRLMSMVEGILDALPARKESAFEELRRSEIEHQVQRVIGRLRPEMRILVVLRYTEGLAYEQIAEILGCSKGTVASRLNRAHKVLERRLSHLRGEVTG